MLNVSEVKVSGGELSEKEVGAYLSHIKEQYPDRDVAWLNLEVDGEFVNMSYELEPLPLSESEESQAILSELLTVSTTQNVPRKKTELNITSDFFNENLDISFAFCYTDYCRLKMLMRGWRNRQTRQLEVLVPETVCGFKSHPSHQNKKPHDSAVFYFVLFTFLSSLFTFLLSPKRLFQLKDKREKIKENVALQGKAKLTLR